MMGSKKSILEARFIELWRAHDGAELAEEFRFHHTRRWRLDYAHLPSMTAIELQGGVWMAKGGHNTGTGITRDCEKGNEAKFLGWTVFHLTKDMIHGANVQRIIDHTNHHKKDNNNVKKKSKN